MKEVLKYLGSSVLIALLLVQASAFHIYEHHDDALGEQENQCEFCLLVIESQQSDLLVSSPDFADDIFDVVFPQLKITSTDFQVNLSPSKSDLLPRPPPSRL